MSFLVLLLAVWIEKFSALRHRVQRDGGWLRELARLEVSPRLVNRPWLILAILVLLPVALLACCCWCWNRWPMACWRYRCTCWW
jgi:AmpE protein